MAGSRQTDTCGLCGQPKQRDLGLCHQCLGKLITKPSFCAEQIRSRLTERSEAALVDAWGRSHFMKDSAVIGRDPDCELALFQRSVSFHHAILTKVSERWFVRDLKSTNGTFIDDVSINGEAELKPDVVVKFGSVAFVFVCGEKLEQLDPSGLPSEGTWRDSASSDRPLRIFEPTGGGGGILQIDGQEIQMTVIQSEMLRLLAERMKKERDEPALVRGFCSSKELLATLSWDTPHPDENHLRQLVRRIRRIFERHGILNIIESRKGFGYRLGFVPRIEP